MSHESASTGDTPPRVGLDLRIETPENVVLTYQLAGPAVRCMAYLIDFGVRAVAAVGLIVFLSCAGLAFALPGVTGGFFLLVLFLMEWGYFVACEGFFKGKSVGKYALGLRVIQERGHPITFWAAMQRNLLRAADAMPIYGVGFLSMLLSRKFQRLGDLLAGTVVIAERRAILPREPIILEKIEPLPRDELGSTVPDARTLSLIDEFLGRRHVLTHQRGHELAGVLARPLAGRLHFRGDPDFVTQYPMAFLARIYVTFIQTREDGEAGPGERPPRRLRRPLAAESRP